MAKIIKTFAEFITEAAAWDDTAKRKIDGYFVSFDEKERYEVRDFINMLIKKYLGKEADKDEVMKVVLTCKDKIPHNHPRKKLIQCVLKHYDIEIGD